MSITTIVITGGPCGGKSTALDRIKSTFSQLGYTVLTVPETATELISGGVAPWTCGTNAAYQACQLDLQLKKESIFIKAAKTMPGDRFLIVCDRGAMDNRAYMTEAEFAELLKQLDTDEAELLGRYGAVFHLVTAAKGAEAFYTTANNSARTESAAEAAALDDRVCKAWAAHPRFEIIDNSTDFAGKLERLITSISVFLQGEHT